MAAFVGYSTTGFLPFRAFSRKFDTNLSQLMLRDRCSLLSSRPLFHFRAGALTQKNEQQILEEEGETKEQLDDIYDEEWQARQREKTREWHAYRDKELKEEERKTNEYKEIGMRLKEYPQEDVCKARILVSDFISSAEEVEERIEAAAEKGELTELVLLVIWNRLDLARRDEETDVIRSLDLLYRRVETEILKREATPSMRLLNDLLNLHDGYDDEGWKKKCRNLMLETFVREDTFGLIIPAGATTVNDQGEIELPPEAADALFRIDFIREVNELLKEVRAEQNDIQIEQGFDTESVAARLKQQEKQRTIHQVEAILELAVNLMW